MLKEKEKQRYEVPCIFELGLEDELGKNSWGNHFDIFSSYEDSELFFYQHFHNPLSIQMFLDLANTVSDIHIFSGSNGKITKDREKDGPSFIIPKDGVLAWPRLESLVTALGIQ